ncbi:MAG TPA: DUF1328 domain-containing protein [Bacteroidia bacterium]|nr:DUF1328 domain-containing protein [Bacteroidia bacterium]
MLCLSFPFFVIAFIAALFGLINIAASIMWVAKIFSFIFFVLFLVALIMGGSDSKKMKG